MFGQRLWYWLYSLFKDFPADVFHLPAPHKCCEMTENANRYFPERKAAPGIKGQEDLEEIQQAMWR